jgi:phosphoadenosine phosphosulfate reductase
MKGERIMAVATIYDLEGLNAGFEKTHPREALFWAVEEFRPNIALACSFSVEDIVCIDMLMEIKQRALVFAIDTGRLNEETYETAQVVRERYGLPIEFYFPERREVERLEREKGLYSFRESLENRHECCRIRKVEPLNRALKGLQAWITGLRRDQSITRTQLRILEVDDAHGGIFKLNPLAAWSSQQVWDYVKERDLPYNRLHSQGYPSIGCAPCTRAIQAGEHPRTGRWWWENPDDKECGLHVKQPAE